MRKLVLSILLIALLFGCYQVVLGDSVVIRKYIPSISQLETSSKKLNTQLAGLDSSSSTEFEKQKQQLTKIIEEYRNTKQEYDQVVSQFSAETAATILELQQNEVKDIYDSDFLWTICGNYATEEGIDLTLKFVKNTTSVSSLNNTSTNFTICDLKFIIEGSYINLTDFIHDLEMDDRLGFEINDFDMQKSGSNLQVTLTVKEVKINKDSLIENNLVNNITNAIDETKDTITQKVDSGTTSNTTNTTNTTTSQKQNTTVN